ncbi:O-antigen ligase family protein [uncultured Campylobacter sp.]|jgi:hypothetical protein|uniref:O-antigen ligase family protein n=1 Tax=uncultured Campylobacter sp. TaxID=218934 RepID=UPI00262943C1|nr:O-antigen ligase family protein [uncultured Campylobacter sp.]
MLLKFNYEEIMKYLLYILSVSLFVGKSYNIVAALIVVIFLFHTFKNHLFWVFKDRLFIFMSIWCVYMLSSVIWATHKDGIISAVGVLFLWILLYLAIKIYLNSKDKLEKFFKFQACIVLFIAFNALLQFLIGYNIFGVPILNGRATDIFFSSNSRIFPFILPLYVGMFGAMLSLKNRHLSHYILYSSALFGILIAVPLSGSRGPLLLLAVFIPIIVWTSPYRKTAFIMLVVLCVCVISIAFNSDKLQDRLVSLAHPFENQKHLRVAIWKTAIEEFKDNPILGVGFKNFKYRQFDYYKPEFESYEIDKEQNKTVEHAHSPWMDILAEQGIIGFGFAITLFFSIFYSVYRKGTFILISAFSVFYAFSFLNSTFVISKSRWSFFMIFSITIFAIVSSYYQYIKLSNDSRIDEMRR